MKSIAEYKLVNFEYKISKKERNLRNGHNSFLVWFTGLSGAGKSTLANHLEIKLFEKGIHTYALDGDNIRKGISKDLSFSIDDRSENIRRISEISKLFIDNGTIVLASFISPFQKDRDKLKATVGASNYIEIYVDTPLEECENRDVKGLYEKVRKGEIKNFTGISSPYEEPNNPDIKINTQEMDLENSIDKIMTLINEILYL